MNIEKDKKDGDRVEVTQVASSPQTMNIDWSMPSANMDAYHEKIGIRKEFTLPDHTLEPSQPVLPDLWLHPCLQTHAPGVLENEANFLPESQLDVLVVSGQEDHISKNFPSFLI